MRAGRLLTPRRKSVISTGACSAERRDLLFCRRYGYLPRATFFSAKCRVSSAFGIRRKKSRVEYCLPIAASSFVEAPSFLEHSRMLLYFSAQCKGVQALFVRDEDWDQYKPKSFHDAIASFAERDSSSSVQPARNVGQAPCSARPSPAGWISGQSFACPRDDDSDVLQITSLSENKSRRPLFNGKPRALRGFEASGC